MEMISDDSALAWALNLLSVYYPFKSDNRPGTSASVELQIYKFQIETRFPRFLYFNK